MTNLDSILKSGDISLPMKVYIVKALVFPVVMYGCESWATNVDELVSFEMVLEKTFKSPLGSKEIKLVNLKGNHP